MRCRYFPELNNLSTTVNEAPQFAIQDLADLSQVNTCDQDDPGLDIADGKFGLVSAGGNATGNNCSVAERANIIEVDINQINSFFPFFLPSLLCRLLPKSRKRTCANLGRNML